MMQATYLTSSAGYIPAVVYDGAIYPLDGCFDAAIDAIDEAIGVIASLRAAMRSTAWEQADADGQLD